MDLREISKDNQQRHPWEIARAKALRRVLSQKVIRENIAVLDVGCGDGFTVSELFKGTGVGSIDAVDTYLTDQQITEFSHIRPHINFHKSYNSLIKEKYGLVTLFDVIEHVEDDTEFVQKIVTEYAAKEALIILTAPAFEFLFSSHDSFLGHYRRYDLKKMRGLVCATGLAEVSSGYIFTSLIPARLIQVVLESVSNRNRKEVAGIGKWTKGAMISKFIELCLVIDSQIGLWLSECGIKLPGLTVWMLCRKQL